MKIKIIRKKKRNEIGGKVCMCGRIYKTWI